MPPKLRHVLLFSSFADLGRGGQESLFQLASRLDRDRFRPSVVVPGYGSLAQRLADTGIDVHVLNLPKIAAANLRQVASTLRRLSEMIEREQVDILHTDGPRNTFYAGLVGRIKRRPLVWHVRAAACDAYDRLLCRMCSKLILVADSLRDRFHFLLDPLKLVTIHNGVDVDRFRPEANCSKAVTPKRETSDVIIATVGRVEKQKGILNLLQACRDLQGSVPPFKVRVAGEITDPDYFDRCREFCLKKAPSIRVEYLGHAHPIEGVLRAADVFVLPSAGAEAFPRVVLEAMACGKPAIVTDAGGSREAVLDGCTGFVVPANEPFALAARLRVLLQDEGMRAAMGRAGRSRAEACFAIEKNVAQTQQVYAEVLRGR